VVVVGGYRIDRLRAALAAGGHACAVVENDHYEPWNNFYSLLVAEPALGGGAFVQLDGDTILDAQLLPRLLAAPGEAVLAVDCRADLDDEAMKVELAGERVVAISKRLDPARCAGEYIGVAKLSGPAAREVFADLATFPGSGLTHEYYEHAFHRLTSTGRIAVSIVDVHDCSVLEIDTIEDLRRAEALLAARR
jgi:choline kinase